MDCRTVRNRILEGDLETLLEDHLGECPRCARFVRRHRAVRDLLRAPAPTLEADPGFPLRVVARLPQPVEVMGWAALRALPAALLLAMALAWAGLLEPPAPVNLLIAEPEPTADLLLAVGTLTSEVER